MYTFELTKSFFLTTNSSSDTAAAPATSTTVISTSNSNSAITSEKQCQEEQQEEQNNISAKAAAHTRVTFKERFLAGCLAGAISQTLIYPLELIKTRITVATPGTYRNGIYSCIKGIVKHEGGIKTMYKGLGLSVLGIMPYSGLDLTINSILRDKSKEYYQKHYNTEPGVVSLLLCGMVSSTVAMVATYPIGERVNDSMKVGEGC